MLYFFSITFIIPFFIFFTFLSSQAAKLTFRPKVADYYGYAEIKVDYRNKKIETANTSQTTSKTDAREVLTLGAIGYFYHPKLVTFRIEGTGGAQQSTIDSQNEKTSDDSFVEAYDIIARILPTHPYNLSLYTRQILPDLSSGFITSIDRRQYESGALFNYETRPWTSQLSYERTDIRGGNNNYATNTYRALLGYFHKSFFIDSGYNFSDTTTNEDEKIYRNQFFINNHIKKEKFKHRFRFIIDDEEQDFTERTRWTVREIISFELPKNIESDISLIKNSFTTDTTNPTGLSATNNSSDNELYSLDLKHRLYKSLYSRFHTSYHNNDSSSSENKVLKYRISTDYTKKIPDGLLEMGLLARQDDRDNQVKTTQLPGETDLPFNSVTGTIIPLDVNNVDPDTINIEVIDIITNNTFPLTEGLDYDIVRRNDPVSFRVARDISLFLPFADDDARYRVSFFLLPGNYKLQANTYEYTLDLTLFNGFLNTSYLFRTTRQKLKEGVYTRGTLPPKVTLDSFAITLEESPFHVGSEYSQTRSDTRSIDILAIFAGYDRDFLLSKSMTANILLLARKSYFLKETRDNVDRGERSTSTFSAEFDLTKSIIERNLFLNFGGRYIKRRGGRDQPEFQFDTNQGFFIDFEEEETEEIYSANLGLSTTLPSSNIQFSLYGIYQYIDATSIREYYSGNSLLTWDIGRTKISLRAKYTNSSGSSVFDSDETTDSSVHLNVKRELF